MEFCVHNEILYGSLCTQWDNVWKFVHTMRYCMEVCVHNEILYGSLCTKWDIVWKFVYTIRYCMECVFFWVSPRRPSAKSRRFGTLCRFHLHRQAGEIPKRKRITYKTRRKLKIKKYCMEVCVHNEILYGSLCTQCDIVWKSVYTMRY